jgi:hypothetical protein
MEPQQNIYDLNEFVVAGKGRGNDRLCRLCNTYIRRGAYNWPYHLIDRHPEALEKYQDFSLSLTSSEIISRMITTIKTEEMNPTGLTYLLQKFTWSSEADDQSVAYLSKKQEDKRNKRNQRTKGQEQQHKRPKLLHSGSGSGSSASTPASSGSPSVSGSASSASGSASDPLSPPPDLIESLSHSPVLSPPPHPSPSPSRGPDIINMKRIWSECPEVETHRYS